MTKHAVNRNASRSYLDDARAITELIASVTNRAPDEVARLLKAEFRTPGITVAAEFSKRKLTRYAFTDGLERFYSESDAFIFESAVWNRNRIKAQMRRWIGQRLDQWKGARGDGLDVLCIGDGLGFDSAHFASRGHRVIYHEVPGPHEQIARAVFEQAGQSVRVVTDQDEINSETFDAVVCLDVLEHVPDPPGFVKTLVDRLRPGGRLVAHAPFYMIHRAYPTHLKQNRIFSGNLNLYTQHGLQVVDARAFWNPLVFARTVDAVSGPPMPASRKFAMRMIGAYLSLGRWSALPMHPIHWYRRFRRRRLG